MCAPVLRVVLLCAALVCGARARCARRAGARAEGALGEQGHMGSMIRMLKRSDMAEDNREDNMARILYRNVGAEEDKLARIVNSIYGGDEALRGTEFTVMKRGGRIRMKRMAGADDEMCG